MSVRERLALGHPLTLSIMAVAGDWAALEWLGTAFGLRPLILALVWWLMSGTSVVRRLVVAGAVVALGAVGEWWLGEGAGPILAGVLVLALGLIVAELLRRVRGVALRRWGLAALVLLPLLLPVGRAIRSVDLAPPLSVAVVSSVPLGPIADPAGRNRPLMDELRRVGPVTLLDRVPDSGPAADRLLLLQPRQLAPAELVAIDAWVRRGGRALVLADPEFRWPGAHPLGDPRNPLPVSLLDPLLERWGVRLELDEPGSTRANPLALPSPGWLTILSRACRAEAGSRAALCAVGQGEALVVADADWLDPADGTRLAAQVGAMLRHPGQTLDRRDGLPVSLLFLLAGLAALAEQALSRRRTETEHRV